jgi:hypothetical protein
MPVFYNISPELKLVIYICRGSVSGANIFKTSDRVFRDNRRVPRMITIIDFLSAIENIQSGELQEAVRRIESSAERGFAPGPIVILSQSRGPQILVDTINLLAHKVTLKVDIVPTLEAGISLLGLSESKEEIVRFWQESQSLSTSK